MISSTVGVMGVGGRIMIGVDRKWVIVGPRVNAGRKNVNDPFSFAKRKPTFFFDFTTGLPAFNISEALSLATIQKVNIIKFRCF